MMCETMLSRYVSITGLIGFDASPLDSMLFLKACCLTISVKDSKLRPNQSGCGIKCFRWASHCFLIMVFWSKPQSGLLLLKGLFAALMDISKLWWMSFLNLGSVLFLGFQASEFFTVNPVDWLMCSNRLLISLHPLFFFSLRLSFWSKILGQPIIRSSVTNRAITLLLSRFCYQILVLLVFSLMVLFC